MSQEFSPLATFTGAARLFPLPNLVFFPQAVQPLHIFEPRYRQMTADALAGDRLIALVQPRPGWEPNYAGSPALYSVACLGMIVADQKLDDGRYNILLRGLSRIEIDHEIPHGKLYRKAKVELLAEVPVPDGRIDSRLRRKLAKLMPEWFKKQPKLIKELRKLLKKDVPLGAICDILAFTMELDAEFKQTLLEELEVEARVHRLIEHLDIQHAAVAQSARKFPPEFSLN